jgi:hypothetical protein
MVAIREMICFIKDAITHDGILRDDSNIDLGESVCE